MIMLPENYFNPHMPMNQNVRRRHPNCSEGKDRALVITKTQRGWYWYCHRCKEGGFRSADGLSPRQMMGWIKGLKAKPVQRQSKLELPKDFSRSQIPPEGWAWLFAAGLNEQDVQRYQIGYSRKLHRVIIPVYSGSTLIYWQGRSLIDPTPENPRYMNVYQKGRDGIYFQIRDGTADIVLVEDVLSCIRVSKVMDAIALLSAHIPDPLVLELAKEYETIWFWLDRNKRSHMLDRVRRYRSFGINVRMVKSSKDPKYYSEEEIEGRLT